MEICLQYDSRAIVYNRRAFTRLATRVWPDVEIKVAQIFQKGAPKATTAVFNEQLTSDV